MKFWKSLNMLIEETLPEWRDQFLSYKELKKQLKLIYPKDGDKQPPSDGGGSSKRPRLEGGLEKTEGGDCGCSGDENEETWRLRQFVKLLEDEIEKFNAFFVEKEEEYVIKLKELQDRVTKADNSNEFMKVGREIVDFHGEMVLLENYSALNYTGLVKILKKYDKRSGALIRLPFIQKVLQQPFYKTDVLNKLVKECEAVLDRIFSIKEPSSASKATEDKGNCDSSTSTEDIERPLTVPKELSEIENMEGMYMKLTVSALRVLKEIRSGSSTVSMFSLPPLQTNSVDDWKKVPIIEQAAK